MIRHAVAVTLHHEPGSPEEGAFLRNARALAQIPGVRRLEQLRQTSAKSDYAFSVLTEFAGPAPCAAHDAHPLHTTVVRDRWAVEVIHFHELDFEPLELPETMP